jgi:hypothetical protein
MKADPTKPKKPISPIVRRSSRLSGPQERARKDLEAATRAYLEAGHLSPSDLKGEISLLRSVIRRVFALTSEVSDVLEQRQAGAPGEVPPAGRKPWNLRLPAEPDDGEASQLSYLAEPERDMAAGKEGELDTLELWVQTLESLGRGAMRLANLMRTHQALNQAEPEPEEKPAAAPRQQELSSLSEKLEQKSSDLRAALEQKE